MHHFETKTPRADRLITQVTLGCYDTAHRQHLHAALWIAGRDKSSTSGNQMCPSCAACAGWWSCPFGTKQSPEAATVLQSERKKNMFMLHLTCTAFNHRIFPHPPSLFQSTRRVKSNAQQRENTSGRISPPRLTMPLVVRFHYQSWTFSSAKSYGYHEVTGGGTATLVQSGQRKYFP